MSGRKLVAKTNIIERDSRSRDAKEAQMPPPPRLAFGVVEFCEAFGISEDFFYKLKKQGKAPRLMKVGARSLISLQAADEWRVEREREAEAAAKNKIAAEAAE